MLTGTFNKRLLKHRKQIQDILSTMENEFHADERLTDKQEERLDAIIQSLAKASNRILG